MKWFKHLSSANRDEKLARIRDEFGLEGYGLYWLILEIIAEKVDEKNQTFVEFSPKTWRSFTQISTKKFQLFLNFCQKLGIFIVEFSQNLIKVDCPNILKYRDEWTRRKAKNSGVTPEQLLRKDKEEEKEEDKEKKEKEKIKKEKEKKLDLSVERSCSTSDEVELTPPPNPPSSSRSVSVPFKKIKDLWNKKVETNLSALPKLVALNPGSSRGKHVRARWREFPDLAIWEQLFEKATRSSFLNGDNDRGFRGTFDWIVKSSINFSKVLEGNYDDEDEMQAYNNAPIKWKDLIEFNDANPEAVARNMRAGNMDIRTVPPDILAKAKKILEEEERKKQQKEEQKKATHSDPPGSQPQKKPKQRREPLEFKRPDKAKDKSNHEPIDLMKELIAPMCEGRRRQLESVYGPYIKTRERRIAACY